MKKSFKMGISLILATAMVLSLVGCDKKEGGDPNPAPTATVAPTDAPAASEEPQGPVDPYPVKKDAAGNVYDLGGADITWVDWWSDAEGKVAEPTTALEEATLDYHNWLMDKYKFSFKRAGINGWGDNPDNFNALAANGPEDPNQLQLYTIDDRNLSTGLANGLFYDLTKLDCLDFSEEKWEKGVESLMTVGSAIYGMRAELPEPRGGLWFNKRLLTEAGIDPESIYDLQANGQWTWSKFEEILEQCTIDKDGDGTIDQYAMCSFSCDFFPTVVASNNVQPVVVKDGKYVLNQTSDAYVEAIDWGMKIIQKYEMPAPEDAQWDYGRTSFPNGLVTWNVSEEYNAGTFMTTVADDYGFVMFPMGPNATKLTTYSNDNIYVIASSYNDDQAWKIAFAYNVWTDPVPGYEDAEAWKLGYYGNFRDARAVDETLELMSTNVLPKLTRLIPGWDDGPALFYDAYGCADSAMALCEKAVNTLQTYVDDANNN